MRLRLPAVHYPGQEERRRFQEMLLARPGGSARLGCGNLMLTVEQQAASVSELPEVFVPIAGGWRRMGMTHVRLDEASEDVLTGALKTAWKLPRRSGRAVRRKRTGKWEGKPHG